MAKDKERRSLFDRIFGRRPKAEENVPNGFFKTFTAYQPAFINFGGFIYESELVRASVDAIARHCAKLNVNIHGSAHPKLATRLRDKPNAFQTWYKFLYRLATILQVQNTAFIVPVLNEYGDMTGFYPVLPSRCEIVEVGKAKEPYLRYKFQTGDTAAIELWRVGIMTRHQYGDDIFGDKNTPLLSTMELISIQRQGITEAVKNSASYRFMANLTNFSKAEDLAKERKKFTDLNFADEDAGVMLLLPNTYTNVKQIDSKPYVCDADQMKLIKDNVFYYFGVNEKILTNSATDEEMDSFFNGLVEPFEIQLTEVLTDMCFSMRERAEGNAVIVTSNRLQYMSVSHKINMASQLGDRGMMTIDEIRQLFNYPPLPNGAGQTAPIRGEYYDVIKGKDNTNDNTNDNANNANNEEE